MDKDYETLLLEVKESVKNFAIIGAMLNDDDINKNDRPIIWQMKSKGVAFSGVFLDDIFTYLCYLGMGDGILVQDEVDFINYIFEKSWTLEEVSGIIDYTIDKLDLETTPPLSFQIMYEIDLYLMKRDGTASGSNFLMKLINTYEMLGRLMLVSDADIDDDEYDAFEQYMNSLSKSIENMIEFGYDAVVEHIYSEDNENKTRGNVDFSDSIYDTKVNTPNVSSINDNDDDDKTLDDYIDELNELIGLGIVKNDVNSLINLIQVRQVREQRGMKQPPMSLHLVFSGNPGTGKTTVARLLANIYHKMGLLSKGHLIETDRSGLVGGYVGQTAIKTQEVIQKALGGILFIDEAYTLSSSKGETDYGQESIDTILKAMEDNRDDFIVIVAGYPELMREFLQSNPGLQSRFNKFIFFEDYNPEELYEIFKLMCDQNNLILEPEADKYVKTHFVEVYNNRGDNFANGRDVRNLFENVLTKQANRLSANLNVSDKELSTLKYEDFK